MIRTRASLAPAVAGVLLLLGCVGGATDPAPEPARAGAAALPAIDDEAVYLRAEAERTRLLEREVRRLRADLVEAEEAIVAMESGLVGQKTRADAVAATAAAGVAIERVREGAPWRAERIEEASDKLAEAERQLEAESFGAAIFFASRAERVARETLEGAEAALAEPDARRIAASRVNLREGPSTGHPVLEVLAEGTPVVPERTAGEWMLVRTDRGRVGWVHASLVR